jgi:hypothetical protein
MRIVYALALYVHGERLEKSAAHRELLSSRPVSSIPNRLLGYEININRNFVDQPN